MVLMIAMTLFALIINHEIQDVNNNIETLKSDKAMDYNYQLDLQPDYIIIYSKDGNIDTIPYGKLERFLENDNQ